MRLRLVLAVVLAAAAGLARAQGHNVITAVDLKDEGGAVVLTVKGSRPPNFTTFSMADPPRFVIDLAESRFEGVPEDVLVRDGVVNVVKNLSYGSDATAIARVMIAFQVEVDPPEVQSVGDTLVVRVTKPAGLAAAAAAPSEGEAERLAREEQARVAADAEAKAAAEAAAVEAQGAALATRDQAASDEADRLAREEQARIAAAEAAAAQAAADASARAEAERRAAADADRAAFEQAEADRLAAAQAAAVLPPVDEAPPEPYAAAPAEPYAAQPAEPEPLAAASPEPYAPEPQPEPATDDLAAASLAPAPRAQLREVGFRQLPGVSRVFVRTSVTPRFSVEDAGENVIRVELENTSATRRNDTRFLDTSFFSSAVAMVTPTRRGSSYVVEIRLRERVPYQQRIEGDMLALDFARPASLAAADPSAPADAAAGEPLPAAPGEPLEAVPAADEPAAPVPAPGR